MVIGDCKLVNEDCLFKEGIYFEDVEWTPRMLLRAKQVASTETVVYNYLWRSGSITQPIDPQNQEKIVKDKIALLRGFIAQSKMVKDAKWFEWMTSFTTMTILNVLAKMTPSKRTTYLTELKALPIFPLSKYRTNWKGRIKISIANLSPEIYCRVVR